MIFCRNQASLYHSRLSWEWFFTLHIYLQQIPYFPSGKSTKSPVLLSVNATISLFTAATPTMIFHDLRKRGRLICFVKRPEKILKTITTKLFISSATFCRSPWEIKSLTMPSRCMNKSTRTTDRSGYNQNQWYIHKGTPTTTLELVKQNRVANNILRASLVAPKATSTLNTWSSEWEDVFLNSHYE